MSFPGLFPANGSAGPLYGTGWDLVVLGGVKLPGKAKVTNAGIRAKFDPKKGKGKDGARPSVDGLEGQSVDIVVTVWTQEQLDKLEEVCKQLLPQPGVKQGAVAIKAPAVNFLGITDVVILGGSLLTEASEPKGGRQMTISAVHWIAKSTPAGEKKAVSTPTRSVRNRRSEDARKRENPNPPPSQQSSSVAPSNFTPAQ